MNNTEQWTNTEAYKDFWHFLNHSVSQPFLFILLPTAKSKRQQHKLFHTIKNDTTFNCIFWRKYTLSVKFIFISLHTH